MKNFEMHLADAPFKLISSGEKTVEVRLADEKRKQISAGDFITFYNADRSLCVKTRVLRIYGFKTFKELYSSALFEKTGSAGLSAEGAANAIYAYYSAEREKEYGVLGIEIEIIG